MPTTTNNKITALILARYTSKKINCFPVWEKLYIKQLVKLGYLNLTTGGLILSGSRKPEPET